jgi:hypothetical protein
MVDRIHRRDPPFASLDHDTSSHQFGRRDVVVHHHSHHSPAPLPSYYFFFLSTTTPETQSLKCFFGVNLILVVGGFITFGPLASCGLVYSLAATSMDVNLPNLDITTVSFLEIAFHLQEKGPTGYTSTEVRKGLTRGEERGGKFELLGDVPQRKTQREA